jgi:serine protease Do
MAKERRVLGGAVLALALAVPFGMWSLSSDAPTTHAVFAAEKASTPASREGISHARDLSEAFNHVADTLRPSVVSINSVKHVRTKMNRRGLNQQRELPPGIPDQFRQFFDNLPDNFDVPDHDQMGMGSGVIVSADGYVLTNNHVVRGADEVSVVLYDDRELRATIVGVDDKTDIAVLKVEASDLVPAKLGNSDDMKVGQWVLAIGSPFGLDQTVTAGIISAKGRVTGIIGSGGYEDFLQTDAAINPGNSGGPLVNMQGQVIGINTAIASRGGMGAGNVGVGFAIPSNMASSIMQNIRANGGKVVRGYLGAAIQNMNAGLADSFGFNGRRGVLIGSVFENSPAQKAGLREGDIVTELNGRPVETQSQLRNSIAALAPNSKAQLGIFRDGKPQKVTVNVGELAGDTPESQQVIAPAKSTELGLSVEPLTRELAQEIGHKGELQGVVVTQVAPGSVAVQAQLQPGDLIVAIGSQPIKSPNDYRNALDKLDLKAGVRMQVMREGVKRFVFLKSGV